MISLTKQFKQKNLNYSAFSKSKDSATYNKYNVFNDDSSYFFSKEDYADQWWQVSFEAPVFITSYILKSSRCFAGRLKSWIVNVSFDNSTWKTVDTKEDIETYNNDEPNLIENGVYCVHFRIILKKNCNNKNGLIFTFFDAFGKILYLGKGNRTCKQRMCNTNNYFKLVLILVLSR